MIIIIIIKQMLHREYFWWRSHSDITSIIMIPFLERKMKKIRRNTNWKWIKALFQGSMLRLIAPTGQAKSTRCPVLRDRIGVLSTNQVHHFGH